MPHALDTIFSQAVAIDDPAARAAHLDRACGADAALRGQVERLVAAHFRAAPDFLERPAGGATAAYDAAGDTAGFVLTPAGGDAPSAQVGPYKLLEVIGEGGMGTVWLADQQAPVRRRVALKVIKAGMDSRAVLARFEAERQALALMDHPNIARVLDAGATPDGRPYFAMELVKGVPITRYSDDARLPPAERLALFADVCAAVQHAHQKGVIHRDLKPSNVLVGLYDGKPVVKVIDFGVAKAAGQPLTDRTLFTGFGAVVGTPEYMSPEQATLDNVDVDTRSDVYSLGVLLYELLTGSTPVTRERVREAALLEVLRVVREEDAPRPSTRLSSAGARASIAAVRGTEPGRLARLLRGELDWVALRALEKDRARRYESAAALADDVRRFLADEPVRAHPPSALYRLRKFARRRRGVVVAVAVVAAALVGGTAVSVWQAVEANRARADADRERDKAGENYRRARAAVHRMLARVATDEIDLTPAMREVRRRLLDDAVAFYTELLATSPDDAEVYFRRGAAHDDLARYDAAVADYGRAVELDPQHGAAHLALASTLSRNFATPDALRRAVALAERAAEIDPADPNARRELAHYHVALGNRDAALEAIRAFAARAPAGHWRSESDLADVYRKVGDLTSALRHARRAVELAPGEALAQATLAFCLHAAGDGAGALAAADEAVRVIARANDPWNAVVYEFRGSIHLRAGRVALAEADFSRAIDLGPPGIRGGWHQFKRRAAARFRLGRYPEALADIAQAVERHPADGSNLLWIHPDSVAACPDEAFRAGMLAQASRAVELTGGAPEVRAARAALYEAQGRGAEARADWAKAAAGYASKPAARAGVLAQLGHSLLKAGRPAEAETVLRECLAIREKEQPAAWTTENARSLLGGALLKQGKHAEAEPLLLAGYEGMKAREATMPAGSPRLAEAVERLVRLYEATGRPGQAAEWRAKLPREVAPPPRPVTP